MNLSPREAPELPVDLEIPAPPSSTLPAPLRAKLVDSLEPFLKSGLMRRAIATGLGLDRTALDGHPAVKCAASAALVLATGDDDPLAAALRITGQLIDEVKDDEPRRAMALRRLRDELAALRRRDRDPEPGLLGTWLDKVAQDHKTLVPYFQQRTDLTLLDRVYVQLRLSTDQHRRQDKGDLTFRANKPWSLRELLDLDPSKHDWVSQRWVVLGDPGAGKTTLLRHLAARVAREKSMRKKATSWVPIFESLPRLMREPRWLLDRIAYQMRQAGHSADALPAVLDRAGQEGRLLLLLDGLDEVPRGDRDEAEALLRQLAARWPRTPLVVTSRPIGYRRPDVGFQELELLPFDGACRREFLARWFGRQSDEPDTARAEQAATALEKDRSLRDLSSNPLYLTLMALLIEQGASPESERTGLYDQVFELLLNGGYKYPQREPMEARKAVRAVLRHLAHDMTRDNRDAEPVTALEARLYIPSNLPLAPPLALVMCAEEAVAGSALGTCAVLTDSGSSRRPRTWIWASACASPAATSRPWILDHRECGDSRQVRQVSATAAARIADHASEVPIVISCRDGDCLRTPRPNATQPSGCALQRSMQGL